MSDPSQKTAPDLAAWTRAAAKSAPGGDIAALNWNTPEGILVNAICPGFTDTAIVDPLRDLLDAGGVPLMTVDDVLRAISDVLASETAGEAWLVQHGRPPQPYRFRGVPGPGGAR